MALKPASSMVLIQVHGGGLEQMGNYFSTADRSIRNPAFPIAQALGVSALRDSLWLPQCLCCVSLCEGQAVVAACLCLWGKGQKGE